MYRDDSGIRQRRRPGFRAGLIAAVAMSGAMLLLRLVSGVPSVPEMLADGVVSLVPSALFTAVLSALESAAKRFLLAAVVGGQILAGGLLGVAYARWLDRRPGDVAGWRAWLGSAGLAAIVWLATGLVLLPLSGAGLFGANRAAGPAAVGATMLAAYLVYATGLFLARRPLPAGRAAGEPEVAPPDAGRRAVLVKLGVGVAVLAVGGGLYRVLSAAAGGTAATFERILARGEMLPEVTPNEKFYTVSKNFLVDPTVDGGAWKLEVVGLVERPLALTYEQIKELPAETQYTTLTCISNEVGGDLIGNARWRGVRLNHILNLAGPKPGVRKVVLHAADEYTDSITPEVARREANLLAYEMNGEPLPASHGFPLRLLVPGIYGMKNVKWITRIELVDHDFKGYWMQQGWSDEAVIKTSSAITYASPAQPKVGQPLTVGGIAFAGDRGLDRVEVSPDDGQTWLLATIKPALGPFTWVLWLLDWTPSTAGPRTLQVRAADRSGAVQTAEVVESFPDGASGHHHLAVRIAE